MVYSLIREEQEITESQSQQMLLRHSAAHTHARAHTRHESKLQGDSNSNE